MLFYVVELPSFPLKLAHLGHPVLWSIWMYDTHPLIPRNFPGAAQGISRFPLLTKMSITIVQSVISKVGSDAQLGHNKLVFLRYIEMTMSNNRNLKTPHIAYAFSPMESLSIVRIFWGRKCDLVTIDIRVQLSCRPLCDNLEAWERGWGQSGWQQSYCMRQRVYNAPIIWEERWTSERTTTPYTFGSLATVLKSRTGTLLPSLISKDVWWELL